MIKSFALFLSASCLLFTACDNEVQLLEDEPSLPVVYGVYNSGQDQQLVTISKTFRFADGGGAFEAAQSADSVYFSAEELTVIARNKRTGIEVIAERFNATDEGTLRASGDFQTAQNIAYRYSGDALDVAVGDSLTLELVRNNAVLASTSVARLPDLKFKATRPPGTTYPLTSESPFTTSWDIVQNEPVNRALISVIEVGFNFAYTDIVGGESIDRVIYWPASTDTGNDVSIVSTSVRVDGIYGFLAENLEVNPAITRKFRYIQLVITAGDGVFRDFRALIDANRGITSTQPLPPFTNFNGGLGIFTSVTQLKQDANVGSLTPDAFDALFGLEGDVYSVDQLNFAP